MTSIQDKTMFGVALALPITASLLALTVRGFVAPTTAFVFAALVVGTGAIGLSAWKNAQARGSMAQLIHETDTAAPAARGGTQKSGPDLWQRRGFAPTGRIRAFLALSLALTGAILYGWIV